MDPTTSAVPQRIEIRNAPDHHDLYANSIMVKTTLWDMAFHFGRIEQTSDSTNTITQLATVFVSPQQAKALLQVLSQNVAEYEKTFGLIAIAPKGPVPIGKQQLC